MCKNHNFLIYVNRMTDTVFFMICTIYRLLILNISDACSPGTLFFRQPCTQSWYNFKNKCVGLFFKWENNLKRNKLDSFSQTICENSQIWKSFDSLCTCTPIIHTCALFQISQMCVHLERFFETTVHTKLIQFQKQVFWLVLQMRQQSQEKQIG